MCNAWNHSPSCTCGWGGDGHLGRKGLFSELIQSQVKFRTYRDLLFGFTNPNASCPVCGARVYFYSSPFGGRVFFDELGPPWPKHPCTDTGRPVSILPIKASVQANHSINFNRDGWVPFLCQDITQLRNDPAISQLTGLINEQKKTLFAVKVGLSEGAPFLIKSGDGGELWLSTIVSTKNEIKADNFRVFEYESDLRTLLPERQSRQLRPKANSGRQKVERKPVTKTPATNEELPISGLFNRSAAKQLLRCPQCSATVRNLDKHLKNAHVNQNLISCPDCGQLVKHLENHYGKMHSPRALARIEKRKEITAERKANYKKIKQEKKQISTVAKKGICPFCTFKSISEMMLIAHLKAAHGRDPTELLRK
jgi:hypothetical protein